MTWKMIAAIVGLGAAVTLGVEVVMFLVTR
jgi:hypothetical protein